MNVRIYHLIPAFLCFILSCSVASASHMAGGQLSYKYAGDNLYEVTLILYADAINGQPTAIASDTPAYLSVHNGAGYRVTSSATSAFTSSLLMPDEVNPCGGQYSDVLVIKKVFKTTFRLPPDPTGYTIAYQRCCRSAQIENLVDPGDVGVTICCHIPASGIAAVNSCAVFKNDPPLVACINHAFSFDHSAIDADGDSLSYEFCSALTGGSADIVKPVPGPPPYDSTAYLVPAFSSGMPLGSTADFHIDPVTGFMTGHPDRIGNYLICVRCNEWRAGVKINDVEMEYKFIVTTCQSSSPALNATSDTTVLVGSSIYFYAAAPVHVTGYSWSPAMYLSATNIPDPVGHFTDTGNFIYVVDATTDSGCSFLDTVTINVFSSLSLHMPTAFSPNGDNMNDVFRPFLQGGETLKSLKVFDRKGVLMYSGSTGWNGVYNGVQQDIGVYYWELVYENGKSETVKMKGDVTLVR